MLNKYKWLSTVFLLIPIAIYPLQPIDFSIKENAEYDFVHYEKNVLKTPSGDSGNTAYFWEKFYLAANNQSKLNIVHFGGSHIQADIYTNYMRQQLFLLDSTQIASRGLVFPYTAAGTNNPFNYKIQYKGVWKGYRSSVSYHQSTWGVLGISAVTSDANPSISINFANSDVPVSFNKAIVFCNYKTAGYNIETVAGDANFLVDYTHQGYAILTYAQEQNNFELNFSALPNHSELYVWGVLLENNNNGFTYHAIGVNGSKFTSFQRCEKFNEQLAFLHPDMAVISIGTNDSSDPDFDSATYENNFELFMQSILQVNPNCAFVLTVPNDNYIGKKYDNKNLPAVRRSILRLANKFKTHVWDFYGIMGGPNSCKTWLANDMMKSDLVHFTAKGYLLKGELLFSAFMKEYESRFPQEMKE